MEQKSEAVHITPTVLVMRFSALGDIAMTIPVVYGVCNENPDVQFVYVTKKPVAALFQNCPKNLTVEGVDLKNEYKGWSGPFKLWHNLKRKFGITAVADLHGVLRTLIVDALAKLSGVKVARINKMRHKRQELISRGAENCRDTLPPMPALYGDVFRKLGLKTDGEFTDWSLPYPENAKFHDSKPEGEKWVAIAPFAAHKGKIYPLEKMRKVVEIISQNPDIRVFLFGGGGYEAEVLSRWEKEIPGVTNLGGKKAGFANELALMGNCDVMVSMDSANMHLASLCGKPVISIWGATHSAAGFGGRNQKEEWKVEKPLSCRPCSVFGNKVCRFGTYACLTGIEPEEIVSKIEEILGQ